MKPNEKLWKTLFTTVMEFGGCKRSVNVAAEVGNGGAGENSTKAIVKVLESRSLEVDIDAERRPQELCA